MAATPPPVVYALSPSWLVVELEVPLVELHLVVDGAGSPRASWVDEHGHELRLVEVAEA